jgi:hypothetical protein
MVRKLATRLKQVGILLFVFLPLQLLAAGGEKAEAIVIVADSRRFTGWKAWWANLYNESHIWFAVATIVIIPGVSACLGAFTSFLMARIGIDLKSRQLAEH